MRASDGVWSARSFTESPPTGRAEYPPASPGVEPYPAAAVGGSGRPGNLLLTVTRQVEPVVGETPPDLLVISAVGEVDLASAPLLRQVLLDAIGGHPRVLCDLSGTTFLSAAGINALVAARARATTVGSSFHIRGARGIVRRVLRLTRLEQILAVRADA
jgi:anti-anti-sigma factor